MKKICIGQNHPPMIFQHSVFHPRALSGSLFFRTRTTENPRTVILLHGYLESGEIWLPWVKASEWPARIIIPDLPAHGLSAGISTPADFVAWGTALWQFTNEITNQPVDLIGHSMGGYLALEMARLFPDRVGRLVLFHSTPSPDRPEQKVNRQRQINHLLKGKRKLIIKGVGASLFAPQNRLKHETDALMIHKMASQCTSEGMINCLKAITARKDYSSTLNQLGSQALLITGEHDPFMPPNYRENLIHQFPKLQHLHLENSAHGGFLEQPELTLKTVTSFLFP
jgi:pimeloyl-ACP methyl ester carboxylesterase